MRTLDSFILITFLTLITSCHNKQVVSYRAKESKVMNQGDQFLLQQAPKIYIKNCEQVLRTMERLTGVSRNDARVQKVYTDIQGSCPMNSSPDNFDAPQIIAYQKLALEFCDGYVRDVILKGGVKELNANNPPATALSQAALDGLYQDFYSRLWMGPRIGIPSLESLKSRVEPLISDLKSGAPATAPATQAIIQGACGAVLSSSTVITL